MADEENTDVTPEALDEETRSALAEPMPTTGGLLEDVDIEEEMSRDYIDYSMSVIVGRALPDVRDGLKPVHRRCLYSMYMLDNVWNKKHLKSARIVGDVIGKYHPHGDSAVYETIVRMAQNFSLRVPLVDGHGNFGSIDGDGAAAMRYTEVRMQRVTDEMLADLEKDTVDMVPNFDETMTEPSVLPAKLPNLLLNGSSGIAVGMATNIPPHNLAELCDGISYYVDHRDCSIDDLMMFVKGPDFPTGATICGHNGINAMYKLGRGQMCVRGKAEIEEDKNGRSRIVITEIPYAVNKTEMIKHMAELVKDKTIEGIADIRDVSGGHTKGSHASASQKAKDKNGDAIRIEIDLKRDAVGQIVLNKLYKHTELQTTFGAIMLAIDQGRPRILNLKDFFRCYVNHRFEVITRRTKFELKKAEARKHILDGLLIAIANLDDVVRIIRASKNREEAKNRLQEAYHFTDPQVDAILNMRLYQLTGLEREQLEAELAALIAAIAEFHAILADAGKVYAIIKDDLADIKERFASKEEAKRRTEIVADENEVSLKDLIADEPCVITLSNRGYVKRVPLTEYKEQNRGGRGIKGAQLKEEDFLRLVFVAETHDSLMFFTNTGRLFLKDAYEIPEAPRTSFGKPLVNFLNLQEGEQVLRLLPIRSFEGDVDVMFATRDGTVKKTLLGDFKNVNRNGIRAITIDEGDELVEVRLVKPGEDVVMITKNGIGTRFNSNEVRRMGRAAGGVRGISLREGDAVCSLDVVDDSKTLLVATENGYGKRTEFNAYETKHRGGMGVTAIKGADRNGHVVAAHAVRDDESIISITSDGLMVRQRVVDITVVGRGGMGVRLVRLTEGAKLVSVSVADAEPEEAAAPVAEEAPAAPVEATEAASPEGEAVAPETETGTPETPGE
ncbi:MAG: DNA gyrase subunit A [Kiritimatiellae bacterium]|nr:DNA gyrase subunit A [Kiritimatiellia bacterium]